MLRPGVREQLRPHSPRPRSPAPQLCLAALFGTLFAKHVAMTQAGSLICNPEAALSYALSADVAAGGKAPPRPPQMAKKHEPCLDTTPMCTNDFLKHIRQLGWYADQVHVRPLPTKVMLSLWLFLTPELMLPVWLPPILPLKAWHKGLRTCLRNISLSPLAACNYSCYHHDAHKQMICLHQVKRAILQLARVALRACGRRNAFKDAWLPLLQACWEHVPL